MLRLSFREKVIKNSGQPGAHIDAPGLSVLRRRNLTPGEVSLYIDKSSVEIEVNSLECN